MKRCHKCGAEWTRREQPGFKQTCEECTSFLHSCLNCKLYNPSADRCSSITAECAGDRESMTYCEEFQFRDMPNNANRRANDSSRGSGGRRSDSGDGTTLGFANETRANDESTGPSEEATRKFDKLFGE